MNKNSCTANTRKSCFTSRQYAKSNTVAYYTAPKSDYKIATVDPMTLNKNKEFKERRIEIIRNIKSGK